MDFIKNRKIAVIVTVCIMVLATLWGVHRSLNKLSSDIENMFYSDGYGQPNIDTQLKKEAAVVLNVVSILENYPELQNNTLELRNARVNLLDAVSIRSKGAAELRMWFALESMFTFGTQSENGFDNNTGVTFTERDETALTQYFTTLRGAKDAVDRGRNTYNSEVQRFISGESYSPLARIIKPFAFVREPQLFINAQM